MEAALLSFFIVLFAGVFFSALFARLHLPWVLALIIAGIIIGPSSLGFFVPDQTFEFLGEVGLIFLMFMAGLETRLSSFKKGGKDTFTIGFINGAIPFIVGLGIALLFGFGITTALLVGVIFISSSIAVVIPMLDTSGLLHTRLGHAIVGSTMFQDITSLILLSVLFQTSLAPITGLPLPIFYILLIAIIMVLRWLIPRLEQFFARSGSSRVDENIPQHQLHSVFVTLIGTVVVFQLLGLHPIIGGFFAGLVLSDSISDDALKEKLRVISYGLFIPIFFVIIGTKTDIASLSLATGAPLLILTIVAASVLSKLASGWLGAKLVGYNTHDSALIAATSVPQLSTTLAVASTGFAIGLLDQNLTTALVILSIATTFISPLLIRWLRKYKQVVTPE